LKYSATVLPDGEMHHQILKIFEVEVYHIVFAVHKYKLFSRRNPSNFF